MNFYTCLILLLLNYPLLYCVQIKETTNTNGFAMETSLDEQGIQLSTAIRNGDIVSLQRFIEQNYCNIKDDPIGLTGFMILAGNFNQISIVQELIQRGADVNQKDPQGGNTPLVVAACINNPEFLLVLIKAGADVNAKNLKGQTALMLAANFGFQEIMIQLLKAGADLHIKDNGGASAIAYAIISNQKKDVLNILTKQGAELHRGMIEAAELYYRT